MLDVQEILKFLTGLHPFRKMGEEDIDRFVQMIETVDYQQGQTIYQAGDEADCLYLIYSGQVALSRWWKNQEEDTRFLDEGCFFGFEVRHDAISRYETAKAAGQTSLIRIGWQPLLEEADRNNILANYLDAMLESLKVMHSSEMEWCAEQENIQFLARPHQLFFWLKLLPSIFGFGLIVMPLLIYGLVSWSFPLWSLLVMAGVFLLSLGWLLWAYVDYTNDFFAITDRRVVSIEKVAFFYDSRIESPVDAVLSVSTNTGYWGRLFNFGKIIIRTFTGNIIWDRVAYVNQIASMIEEKITRSNSKKVQVEKQAKVDSIRKSLGYQKDEELVEASQPSFQEEEELTFGQWFASLFSLKTQQGGTVVYRTHWFLLIKRTWLAFGLMVGWVAFLTAWLSGFLSALSWQVILVILALWFFILAIVWVYEFIDWRNDQYILTEDQIIDTSRKPLGRDEKRSAPLNNILSIEYKRLGLIGLILNFGTVFIHIGEEEFTFDNVADPSEVQHEISSRIAAVKQREKQEMLEQEREQMVEWLEAYHQAVKNNSGMGTDG